MNNGYPPLLSLALFAASMLLTGPATWGAEPQSDYFRSHVAPILERHCLRCHHEDSKKGGLSLTSRVAALKGGESGLAIVPGNPADSLLLQYIEGDQPEMPRDGAPLSKDQIASLEKWIRDGAAWPDGMTLQDRQFEVLDWWSLQPLTRPRVPVVGAPRKIDIDPPRSVIDAYIRQKLDDKNLHAAPAADRRTLIRRLSFDLHGMSPDPEDVDEFVNDHSPTAYERLVDRLLASPRFGERWARHWLDVVHYGDTHGYDKDKMRPNAWPYRDYVIRSFNEDKPYDQFVLEQLAGDVLWPDTADGITATGFIAAGPWDFIGHAEVPESKVDGQIARNLDRDDMVTSTLNTFCSLTVQCARCHNHKFDPVSQQDYYRLQAVFAAVDRADRGFDTDPVVARRRRELLAEQQRLLAVKSGLEAEIVRIGGEELKSLDQQIQSAEKTSPTARSPEYGYHSSIESTADKPKWVQVDLGRDVAIESLAFVACWDDFNGIGAGFGFPVRFKIEVSRDETFETGRQVILDRTGAGVPNPGTTRQQIPVRDVVTRYVRITATRLAPRQNDFIFAIAELEVFDAAGGNVASGRPVTALDSIEAPVRWSKKNLVDGIYSKQATADVVALRERRMAMLQKLVPQAVWDDLDKTGGDLASVSRSLASLPPLQFVYAGMVYSGSGTFAGTGASGGTPRVIRILKRGDVTTPGETVEPGYVPLADQQSGVFALPAKHLEAERRSALAHWIVNDQHPLTWRSIVNRLWQHHLGRGIVDSPNDFGRMGQLPTHLELLDWLACELRGPMPGESPQATAEQARSLKRLHRLICCSSTYRQSSQPGEPELAAGDRADSGNLLYWRANRRKVDAESLRDSMLLIAGRLDDRMQGPAFQDFVVEKPEHSPHYEYKLYDVEDPKGLRRSIYRFLVRSQTQPFMTTLDCADPSMIVDKRNETVTALQALAMLNNKLVLSMSRHLAGRLESITSDATSQVEQAFRWGLARPPTTAELEVLLAYRKAHGLDQMCRLLFNLNEFAFVD